MKLPLASALLAISVTALAEPLVKPDDTIALAGGANIERTRFYPWLQTQLVAAFPDGALKVRNFGWEGDTVFEQWRDGGDVEKLDAKRRESEKRIQAETGTTSWRQQRDWNQQLTDAGATVVLAQFGQMESLAGPDGIPVDARFCTGHPDIYAANILITELTFFRPEHRKDKIHKFGHTHLDDILDRADRFRNELLILSHFSTRYHDQQIRKAIERRLTDRIQSRVELWL